MSSDSGYVLTTHNEKSNLQAMQISQSKHLMPVAKSHKQLVGSGVNKTLAQMISDDFAFKAKENGVVSKIDIKNKVAILNYDNGKRDAIDLEETYVKNSNSGFYLQQKFLIKYKEGERFNKGDVIAYNPQFFSGKGNDIDYHPGTLAKIAIAAGDFSYEDSALITDKLAKKTASHVVMLKQVALGENTIIHDMVKVGDQVKVGDSLMEFTTSFDDPSAADFLANIAASMGSEMTDLITNDDVRSKYTGEIAEIKVYYNTPYADLHPTLQKLIKTNKGRYDKKIDALEGIKSTNVRIQSFDKQESDKVGATKYEGVMIEFYIMTENQMAEGDKGTFTTALKFIASKRLTDEESPIGEYRDDEIIEAVLTPTGIISRMVSDIYLISFSNKVLIELGKQINEIMNNER